METIKIQRHEMQYRALGKTNIEISALSFGAGPVSSLMVGDDGDRQRAVVRRAVELGINWFDTAATYGAGQSERNLGRVFDELGIAAQVHVATKVRLMPDDLGDIRGAVKRSFEGSLERLQLQRVTLLQLHNSVTRQRGDEPTSVTPQDVLGGSGITAAFEELRAEGLISHLGLTGIGDPTALEELVRSGQFATIQVPYHLLNPSAGRSMPAGFAETNYGNIIAACSQNQMGVLAIRVLAGGALANSPPSPHTFKTPFFPLELYRRDRRRASNLQATLGADRQLPREAIRFALIHPSVSSALIGFAEPRQIEEAVESLISVEPSLDWDAVLAAELVD